LCFYIPEILCSYCLNLILVLLITVGLTVPQSMIIKLNLK